MTSKTNRRAVPPRAAATDLGVEPELQALISTWNDAHRRLQESYGARCAAEVRISQLEEEAAKQREANAEATALHSQAVRDYHATGRQVAALQAKTMAGIIAKLFAAAQHVTSDELDDDPHIAILAGVALDVQALANVRNGAIAEDADRVLAQEEEESA